ncbi:MAG: DUF3656 domain-containing U32 family peptidase [Cellulosilyticaceae bacterium]
MTKVELLAPVGKFENALAAIENGADAIFVGGKLFNARQFAENFQDDELEQIVSYCKLRGIKTYVTVNTLVKNQEIEEMYQYLAYLCGLQVDGIIVQDMGVAHLAKTYFPSLVLHASTQMTAHSLEDVLFLKSLGFARVVLAREIGLEEIKHIVKESGVEIETFIHGALCYSYSGQCLLSSFIGGRSGNRGRCAQPCRMQYSLHKEGEKVIDQLHLMSPKDICTLSILPQLVEAGITSFKIEGRMKSPEYVASVVGIYRKYVDLVKMGGDYAVAPQDLADLQSIFNRGGFSKGYYLQKSGKSMITEKTPKNIGLHIGKVLEYHAKTKIATIMTEKELHPGDGLEIWNAKVHTGTGIDKVMPAGEAFKVQVKERVDVGAPVYLSKNHELLKSLRKSYEKAERKLGIHVTIHGQMGESVVYTMHYEDHHVTVSHGMIDKAQKAPIPKEQALKQLLKLGATSFKAESYEIEWPEDGYIGISQLNELRRMGVEALEKTILAKKGSLPQVSYKPIHFEKDKMQDKHYSASVYTLEQLDVVLEEVCVEKIYWEWQYDEIPVKEALERTHAAGKVFYLAFPQIMRNSIWERFADQITSFKKLDVDGYLCRTYGQFHDLEESGKPRDLDYMMNVFNNESVTYWKVLGAQVVTLSMELSKKEVEDFGGEGIQKVVYGHVPMMTTEQCILGNYGHCQKKKAHTFYTLEDRKNAKWPLKTDCEACYMQVLSEQPIALDMSRDFEELAISDYKLQFHHESGEQVRAVLEQICHQGNMIGDTSLGIWLKSIE